MSMQTLENVVTLNVELDSGRVVVVAFDKIADISDGTLSFYILGEVNQEEEKELKEKLQKMVEDSLRKYLNEIDEKMEEENEKDS